ncbi:PTS system EIIB component [Proteus mirabilis]|uniref:PTS system EIIB component n=1 Tax=Proteus mirabilis TaxID=584 RepID=A0A2X2DKF9_PROMI|nr:PTS system EIIB component [Proteus mirabilis]
MMKITVVCGNGLGSSLMMEMSIKSILKRSGRQC